MTPDSLHTLLTARKKQSPYARTRDVLLTVLLWVIYFIFMKDVFFFFNDVVDWAQHGFTGGATYKSFEVLPTFITYLEVMLLMAAGYLGWARYNQMRFRGKNRRQASQPVSPEELAHFYRVRVDQVQQWQQAKSLIFYHDDAGQIINVDVPSNTNDL